MTEKIVNRALKVRIYPTQQQKTFLDKSLGCSRFFYNYRLNEQIEFYKNEIEPIKDNEKLKNEKYKSFKATTKKQFKEKFEWAKECSDDCLNSTERNLQSAFNNFFKSLNKSRKGKMGFPKFRSKKEHKDSYTECHVKKNAFDFHNRKINISKCTPIYFKHREKLPKWYNEENCTLKSITLSKNSSGEYYASLLFELPSFYANSKPIDEKQAIGLDWSPNEFYIDSECHSAYKHFGYIKQKQGLYWDSENQKEIQTKIPKKLTKLQRSLARKTKGSVNYEKARIKLARLEKYIADSRRWWIENESLRLVKNYSTIGIEDLRLQNISKMLRNAKNVTDCAWSTFVNRLIQKGEELGTSVIKVAWNFPSSQLCHVCGFKNIKVKNLNIREWICPSCGTFHIRDHNASINLKNEALRLSVPMRRGEFRSVEDVENVHLLVLQALSIGASVETESGVCENPQKTYSF
jgi:putative transposase